MQSHYGIVIFNTRLVMSFFFSFCFFTNPRCHAKRKAYKTSWFDL